MATVMRISPAGLALLKAYEKFSPDVYLDQARLATIYWGHRVKPGERFNHTKEEGDAILVSDLGWAEQCVSTWCARAALNQDEFDALVCFTFNIGGSAFQTSTLRRLVVAGNMAGAAEQFLRWDKERDARTGQLLESPGLLKRRTAEMHLFLGKPWSPP